MRERRPPSRRLLRLLPSLALAVGALLPAARAVAQDLCTRIGYAAYVIAEYEERGESRAEQVEHIEARLRDPSPELRRYLLRLVDLVYRSDAPARELGAAVTRNCVVDERGRAVVSPDGLDERTQ